MTDGVRRAINDVRVLGVGAVGRVLYELAKRLGVHSAALGVLAKRATRHQPLLFGSSSRWSGNTTAGSSDSRSSPGHHTSCFGLALDPALASDWHWTVEHHQAWPALPWWKIDIRSDRRIADVKWTWELGRHAHLVVLARNASLGDEQALDDLRAQLRSWLDQNPPEIGVHWYSNLEIGLRAIAWAQILGLVGDRLGDDLRREMAATLRHSGRHMLVELPYTVSSMRNNHLLGDALGMMVIGELFPTTREGRFLRRVGNRIFGKQLARQVHDDGSMIEDSISYHRFVLEMLAVRTLLPTGDHDTRTALLRAAQFMFRLGVGDGEVPQYGDWDEGRVLAVGENRTDLLGSARVALALAGSGAPEDWRKEHEEVAWYVGDGEPVAPEPAERDGHDIGGGIARARRGPFTAWLKAGSGPSHGHADLCSTPILFDGTWLVGDPGTGTYNGPIEQRNYFRCSVAHNVLRVEGLDQLEPHRAFRWLHSAKGVVGPPLDAGEAVAMWGVHDAYRRLAPSRRVARAVVLADDLVVVADWVEGPPTAYALSFPLHPTVSWDDGELVLPDGRRVRLDLPGEPSGVTGQAAPYDGWWSRTYGHAEPATRLEVHGVTAGPVAWALRAGSPVPVSVDGNRLGVGDDGFEILWRENGAALTHFRAGGSERTATVALG